MSCTARKLIQKIKIVCTRQRGTAKEATILLYTLFQSEFTNSNGNTMGLNKPVEFALNGAAKA
jgi:hypothetical protein